MEFNPPPLANPAANQHLDNAANFACETLYEKVGRATVRYKAALNMFINIGNTYITVAELGQQATFLVQQALLAGAAAPTAGAADAAAVVVDDDITPPAWAMAMQDNLLSTMNELQATLQASTNNLQTNLHASVNNINARLENGLISEEADYIVMITNHVGEAPPDFPSDYNALTMLSDERIVDLLTFYGLELAFTAMARQAQLRLHLGIRTTL